MKRGTIEVKRLVRSESLARHGGQRRCGEAVFPVLDPHGRLEMLVRVFMRNDGGALRIQPLVAVGVIEVPVGVDQVGDWIAAEAVDRFEDAAARCGDAGIDKHLAVGARQDGDVAARALDDRDIAAQLMELDGGFCCGVRESGRRCRVARKRLLPRWTMRRWWRGLRRPHNRCRSLGGTGPGDNARTSRNLWLIVAGCLARRSVSPPLRSEEPRTTIRIGRGAKVPLGRAGHFGMLSLRRSWRSSPWRPPAAPPELPLLPLAPRRMQAQRVARGRFLRGARGTLFDFRSTTDHAAATATATIVIAIAIAIAALACLVRRTRQALRSGQRHARVSSTSAAS